MKFYVMWIQTGTGDCEPSAAGLDEFATREEADARIAALRKEYGSFVDANILYGMLLL
jgi:hypothetical protein